MNTKKTFRYVAGTIIFLLLSGLLYFGYIYLKYNEDLPTGAQGLEADAVAQKMLDALNYKALDSTSYIEWTFKNLNHYKWYKSEGVCQVIWKDYKVSLNLMDFEQSQAFVHNFEVHEEQAKTLIEQATDKFNNDSFWLLAPYKIFDPGTERRLVNSGGKIELLVTFTEGGSTPGDSYLWKLDDSGRPVSFKMWTSIIPINGLEASWTDWITTSSGAILPTHHKVLFVGIDLGGVKATK
ncbi:MAG: hypothetical protein KJO77_03345 [Bacteroidia bacterium]|nr:hypothetical protein [Bacteroidia bacterium]